MSRDIIIGIDAGTSVIKSVAFTTTGEQIAMAAVPNAYRRAGLGGVEQDMARTAILAEVAVRSRAAATMASCSAVVRSFQKVWF